MLWLLPHNGRFMTSQWFLLLQYFIMTIQCLTYDITITYLLQHISIWHQNSFDNIRIDYNINIVASDITIHVFTILAYDIVIDWDIIIIGLRYANGFYEFKIEYDIIMVSLWDHNYDVIMISVWCANYFRIHN